MERNDLDVLQQKCERLRKRLFKLGLDAQTSVAQKLLYRAEDLVSDAERCIDAAFADIVRNTKKRMRE